MRFLFIPSVLLLFLCSCQTAKADDEIDNFLNAANISTTSSVGATMLASGCNIFRGKWVYDAQYPLYDYASCPFIDTEFNCLLYKRPDKLYLKYRWQPFSCNIPRYKLHECSSELFNLNFGFLNSLLVWDWSSNSATFFLQV